MDIKAIDVDRTKLPERLVRGFPPGQVFLTVGKTYEVYSLAVFQGEVYLHVIDDLEEHQAWYPRWLFELSEPSVPVDWICKIFNEEPTMILGPEYVASSQEAYRAIADSELPEIGYFWRRVEQLKAEREAEAGE